MRVSVGLYPTASVAHLVEVARVLDDSSCDTMWIGDSHLIWRECWSTIAACSVATERLRFGPCVSNPVTRHPSVTASTVATLQELSGGRIRLGMGVGDSALRMTIGRGGTLKELRSGYALIRGLLETGVAVSEDRSLEIALTAPGTEIYLSGSGPRTTALAGELGDGAILVPGVNPAHIAQVDAALAPGESLRPDGSAPVRRMLWVACSIREDAGEALDDVRPFVASVLRHPLAFEVSAEVGRIQASIRAQYEFGDHMARAAGHADTVPDGVVKEFALAGTKDDVATGLERLRDEVAGSVDEVALVLMTPDRLRTASELREILA
jgi:5,10-methylenetetrahydromethanopterin reductase